MPERTLSIIKPDAVRKNRIGAIIARLEDADLRVVAAQMMTLSRERAGEFYAVHRERPFYDSLLDFMTSGPVLVQVLEGDNAQIGVLQTGDNCANAVFAHGVGFDNG